MVDILNKNFLSPLNFKFQLKRAPHINFFVQTANIPGLALPAINVPSPLIRVPFPGDHLQYDELTITFRVDEDMQNYFEIHNWIRGLGKLSYIEYQNLAQTPVYTGESLTSDISLIVLTSQKNPNYEFTFRDAFPISLSGMEFTTMAEDVAYIEASASFRYIYYDAQKVSNYS